MDKKNGFDPNAAKDIYDEIGKVFENLENLDVGAEKGIYSQLDALSSRPRRNVKKLAKKGDIDWMKAFVEAPFQYQEAFLSLRTNLSFLATNKDLKKIVITSTLPSEGKTSIAVNLSLALSAANHKVVLIDADLRKPLIHKYLRLPNGNKMGVTSILQSKDGSSKGCLHHNIDRKGLSVIPCGVIPPNPTEMLSSQRMQMMIKQLGELYDYVIIDTPPVSIVTDAAVLSQFADGVVFVVRQKTATFEQARLAKKNLDAVNANILGVVINDFDMKHVDKSNAYYYSYYNYRTHQK
ncbi:MAG: CpsD/CapB family tyrosine-protein kinase [Oscillospiraceae bacterium]|nr:CpsD/CapB family tyrosine-protein kinase [Oscillospiraceae bacterium]